MSKNPKRHDYKALFRAAAVSEMVGIAGIMAGVYEQSYLAAGLGIIACDLAVAAAFLGIKTYDDTRCDRFEFEVELPIRNPGAIEKGTLEKTIEKDL